MSAQMKAPAPGNEWFSKLFGFSETNYTVAKDWLRLDGNMLRSEANGSQYKVGIFERPSLAQLQTAVPLLPTGHLKVVNELGDIADKHADPANRHATFQVASQFNCLEFVDPNITPEQGVTGYVNDRTQGPACSIACGPATVFRNYFVPMPEIEGRPQFGQTRENMINNLEDVSRQLGNVNGQMFRVRGGYTIANNAELTKLNGEIRSLDQHGQDRLRNALKVGVHMDVQVTATKWGRKSVDDPAQTVTQVFASACSVAYNAGSMPESWKDFAILILEASYEATLYAAVLTQKRHPKDPGAKKVFLTMLGGGVFGNKPEWIYLAMRRAFNKFKNSNLEVHIVTYQGPIDAPLQAFQHDFPGEVTSRHIDTPTQEPTKKIVKVFHQCAHAVQQKIKGLTESWKPNTAQRRGKGKIPTKKDASRVQKPIHSRWEVDSQKFQWKSQHKRGSK